MNLVFFLEELSAKEMLKGLLPKILPGDVHMHYIVFEGKRDLEKRMVIKMQGWRVPDSRFVVLRDKDAGDCLQVKQTLVEKCQLAGRTDTLVRIACHELESWYLGDLHAVRTGLGLSFGASQESAKFRDPDLLGNAAEELDKLTSGRYQKVGGSRDIGPHLDPDNNRSVSFGYFVSGLRRLIER